tara:strand:- start:416 stop:580 length:165 start_codon:yes stop_codon:yes gene_type:complete
MTVNELRLCSIEEFGASIVGSEQANNRTNSAPQINLRMIKTPLRTKHFESFAAD